MLNNPFFDQFVDALLEYCVAGLVGWWWDVLLFVDINSLVKGGLDFVWCVNRGGGFCYLDIGSVDECYVWLDGGRRST